MADPKFYRSNEIVTDLVDKLQEAVREQTQSAGILGSIHLVMLKDADGRIHMNAINKVPIPVFQCELNVAHLHRDFSNWLFDMVRAAHEEKGGCAGDDPL